MDTGISFQVDSYQKIAVTSVLVVINKESSFLIEGSADDVEVEASVAGCFDMASLTCDYWCQSRNHTHSHD